MAEPAPYGDDADLLAGAAAGEPSAVRALLDLTGSKVYGFLFARVGGNEPVAEDLAQETYVEAMRSAHTFRGESSLSTWLCSIARRRVARHFERERREEVARSGLYAVAPPAEATEERDAVVRALGRLPAAQRQALVLKYLDDLTVEQVAAQLGRTRVQIQSLLQRGRDGLRRELGAEA
ncbi:MAG TPA: sigma-70 family RNA polymerase sigma factor [Actinomycetota bacterium]